MSQGSPDEAPSTPWPWVRRILLAVCIVTATLLSFALRTLWSGQVALARAEAAFDQGELRESVRAARRAAALYVPGAPHVGSAYQRLQIIGQGAEAAGQLHLAAFAWNAMRSAALESSAPGVGRPELELANQHLARLASRLVVAPPGAEASAEQAERDILRTLERPQATSRTAALVLGVGLLLVASGLLWIGFRGLTPDGRVLGRHWLLGALACLLGAACWTFAAYRA